MGEYKPIYPLLADYWDKQLAELPGELMPIVTALFFALAWDDAGTSQRQERIKGYDQLKDPANEADTWAALYLYLPYDECRDMGLWTVIAQAKRDGKDSVVAVLDKIAEKILAIANENFPRDGIQSVLWPALYRLSLSLAARRDEAIKDKDYQLANAVKDVTEQLERILDIDRVRVGDAVVAAFDAEIAQDVEVSSKAGFDVDGKLAPVPQANKLRTNTLDPAIDKAIEQAGCTTLAQVYLELKGLAIEECKPFTGEVDGGSLCYTDDENKPAKLSRNALGKRLKRRYPPLAAVSRR